jgi:hypothetical protein
MWAVWEEFADWMQLTLSAELDRLDASPRQPFKNAQPRENPQKSKTSYFESQAKHFPPAGLALVFIPTAKPDFDVFGEKTTLT